MSSAINWYNNIKSIYRLVLCLCIALVAAGILYVEKLDWVNNLLISWGTFSACMIALTWATFITIPANELCVKAQVQDESRSVVFLIIVLSVCISFFGIIFVLMEKGETSSQKNLHAIFSLVGVILSWFLLHTIFTLHYAHLHYIEGKDEKETEKLNFPDEPEPNYLDFAYFSFTVGMTFQVSDVTVSSRRIRRLVLLHGLISFIFNVIIIALTISILPDIEVRKKD